MSEQDSRAVHHPAVVAHRKSRAGDVQLRIADAITKFAGSPTLTLVVSLEAIFLSAFVMIGQNRQAA
ncbi:hypothetical protein [Streptomyces canus]|uniref:hypothetical protein n=1 Tax=Streptomyces canus TaxID=58343 RepID=UPI002E27FDE9|nr:hypothetical protein [Streptomyces canus]